MASKFKFFGGLLILTLVLIVIGVGCILLVYYVKPSPIVSVTTTDAILDAVLTVSSSVISAGDVVRITLDHLTENKNVSFECYEPVTKTSLHRKANRQKDGTCQVDVQLDMMGIYTIYVYVDGKQIVTQSLDNGVMVTRNLGKINHTINVTLGVAHSLDFITQPCDENLVGEIIHPAICIAIRDKGHNLIRKEGHEVMLELEKMVRNTSPEDNGVAIETINHLSGTLQSLTMDGIATFKDISIDASGVGYILKASNGSVVAFSEEFSIQPKHDFIESNLLPEGWRGCSSCLLPDGRIFITRVEGHDSEIIAQSTDQKAVSSYLLNIETRVLSKGPNINTSKMINMTITNHQSILLRDGRVLICYNDRSAEIFDYKRNTFEKMSDMHHSRSNFTMSLLPDGRVLILGGHTSVEFFYSETNQFQVLEQHDVLLNRAYHTTTCLNEQLTLISGGIDLSNNGMPTRSCLLFHHFKNKFTLTTNLNIARYQHAATRFQNNKLLIAGGMNMHALFSTEIYDVNTEEWKFSTELQEPKPYAISMLLKNGNILLCGSNGSIEIKDVLKDEWKLIQQGSDGESDKPVLISLNVDESMNQPKEDNVMNQFKAKATALLMGKHAFKLYFE